jgi:prenylcysteine oxidase/farnesylcysteine lyase
MTTALDRVYQQSPPRWNNMSALVDEFGWAEPLSKTGLEYFTSQGVSEKFVRELISAATRVNYAQNVDTIHGIGAAVSLAADNAVAIEGGNWRVFEQFVNRSGARLLLNTEVGCDVVYAFQMFSHTWKRGIGPVDQEGRLWKLDD